MLILLPPSRGTSPAGRGRPVDPDTLSFPELSGTRRTIGDAVAAAATRPDAAAIFDVSPALLGRVRASATLWSNPARRAIELYTGVLYAALDHGSLDPAAKRRAAHRLVMMSPLWGPVRPADRITDYRLAPDTALPGVGTPASRWRAVLGPALVPAVGDGLIVDCRSTEYLTMWRPTGRAATRWVRVTVVRERDGRRSVVSHLAKHTRGQVARRLVSLAEDPRDPRELPALLDRPARLAPPTRPGAPWELVVVES